MQRGCRDTWLVSCGVLLCGALYISTFWGDAAHYLPKPLNHWSGFYYRFIGPHWHAQLEELLAVDLRIQFFFLIQSFTLGLFLPVLALWLSRRPLAGFGLGRPTVLALRFIGLDLLFSLPFGFWLLHIMGSQLVDSSAYMINLAKMVPEHFLIFGVLVGLLLPERQLPYPALMSAVEGPWWRRTLRWLGLAQEVSADTNHFLGWFGLTRHSLFAIVGSGFLFAMTHIGKQHTLEVVMSLPVGVLFAYLTFRSHSILPSLISHWSLNLAPLAVQSLL